jgi:hypothetical protein
VNEDLDNISYEITHKATDRPKASATQAGRQSASSYYHEGFGFKYFSVPELGSGLSIYKAANLNPYRAGKMPEKKDGLSGCDFARYGCCIGLSCALIILLALSGGITGGLALYNVHNLDIVATPSTLPTGAHTDSSVLLESSTNTEKELTSTQQA